MRCRAFLGLSVLCFSSMYHGFIGPFDFKAFTSSVDDEKPYTFSFENEYTIISRLAFSSNVIARNINT